MTTVCYFAPQFACYLGIKGTLICEPEGLLSGLNIVISEYLFDNGVANKYSVSVRSRYIERRIVMLVMLSRRTLKIETFKRILVRAKKLVKFEHRKIVFVKVESRVTRDI